MPTYDYRCKACGHELDMFQSMSERPKRKCPACGKNQLERLIGMGGALLFKGKGAWQTDYRSKSYTEGEKKEKEALEAAKPEAKKTPDKSDKPDGSSKTAKNPKPAPDPKAKPSGGKPPKRKA